ncbi:MAG: dUTP pyrophosphatase [Kiritimatiellia bacterium]|jgi:dUTP pyrophosphatase
MHVREVEIRVLSHGKGLELPTYGSQLSAGCDLRAAVTEPLLLAPGQRVLVPTGLCVALPADCELQVRPRSGLAVRHGITVLNSPGTIDADYRGEIKVLLVNLGHDDFVIERGERVAQVVLAPVVHISWKPVVVLDRTDRGAGGFGSTGN